MSNKCIVHNKHFKTLAEMSGLSPMQLEAKMNLWMEKNNTEEWPSLDQLVVENKSTVVIKPGVSELFENNPELVESIYETLGFRTKSMSDEFSAHYGGDEKSLHDVMKFYDSAIVNKNETSKFDKFTIIISDFIRSHVTPDTDIKIRFLNFEDKSKEEAFFGNNLAYYSPQKNTIVINGNSGLIDRDSIHVINHEIIHGLTFYAYHNNADFKNRLDALYEYAKKQSQTYRLSDYGFTNSIEFIAEAVSNPRFAELLDSIESENKSSSIKSMLDEIIKVVKEALEIFRSKPSISSRSILDDVFGLLNEYSSDVNYNKVMPKQKQYAQQKFQEYMNATGKQDIDGFKEFVGNNSTNKTISIEPNYAVNFADSADSYIDSEVEAEIGREQNEAKVDEEIGVKETLTEEEYWVGDRLTFSNLTETLALQHRDTDNELRNLYDEKNKATGKNRDKLNKKIAELEERLSMLKDKVEESNKIANLEQIVQYGVDAYKEVEKILSGEVNAAQLNYAKRVVDFWINAGKKEHSQFGHVLFGEMYYDKVPAEIQEGLFDIREAMADMSNKIHTLDRQFVTDMVNKQLRADYSVDDIYRAFRDINFGEEMAFGLGDYGSPLLSAMYASMNKADYFAAEEFRVVSKDIDRLFKDADKFMPGKGADKYKMFMQEQNGVLTGDLVKIFSKDYFDTKYEKLKAAQNAGTKEA